MEQVANNRCFGGQQQRFKHRAESLNCDMHFSIYLPPQAEKGPVPLLYWLSGLTCTDENFVTKAGAQRAAAQHGIAIVAPDTSPRGEGVPDDPNGAYDLGLGAGFYVNATQAPWDRHYHMADYIVEELPALLAKHFPLLSEQCGIFGHSMGGHGALTLAMKSPGRYRSLSAFAPISSPSRCPWGEKALGTYLGQDKSAWAQHDASVLMAKAEKLPTLVDQGSSDNFLEEQLRPDLLIEAATAVGYPLRSRMQPGYDHSYFFIASFIDEHIAFHSEHITA